MDEHETSAAGAGAGGASAAPSGGTGTFGSGLPNHFHADEYANTPASRARFHVIPVPYEATVSYGRGTARGPEAILAASREIEAFDGVSCPGDGGIHTSPPVDSSGSPEDVLARVESAVTGALGARSAGNDAAQEAAQDTEDGSGSHPPSPDTDRPDSAPSPSAPAPAVPVLLGGEHSITFPAVAAVASHWGAPVGLVQIDAHADLRAEYAGTRLSHACVARRIHEELGLPIVQVGVRALSLEEAEYRGRSAPPEPGSAQPADKGPASPSPRGESPPPPAGESPPAPAIVAYDAREIVPGQDSRIELPDDFPELVYLTIDVDGLDPAVFPATGTPVPGGLGWYQTLDIIDSVCRARHVIAFDVVELAPVSGFHAPDYAAAELAYRVMGMIARNRESPGPR